MKPFIYRRLLLHEFMSCMYSLYIDAIDTPTSLLLYPHIDDISSSVLLKNKLTANLSISCRDIMHNCLHISKDSDTLLTFTFFQLTTCCAHLVMSLYIIKIDCSTWKAICNGPDISINFVKSFWNTKLCLNTLRSYTQ
jgi:hypothetical protein